MSQSYPRVQWAMGEPIQHFMALTAAVVYQPNQAGRSIQISTTTASVTVTLTTVDTTTIVVNPAVGDNIYPYAVITAVPASSTSSFTFTNLS